MSSSATEGVPTSDGQRFIPGDGPNVHLLSEHTRHDVDQLRALLWRQLRMQRLRHEDHVYVVSRGNKPAGVKTPQYTHMREIKKEIEQSL